MTIPINQPLQWLMNKSESAPDLEYGGEFVGSLPYAMMREIKDHLHDHGIMPRQTKLHEIYEWGDCGLQGFSCVIKFGLETGRGVRTIFRFASEEPQ